MKKPSQIRKLGSPLMRLFGYLSGARATRVPHTRSMQNWIAQWSKTQHQPWYLLLNPTGVDSQEFLEHVLPKSSDRALFHHQGKGEIPLWITEPALVIEIQDHHEVTPQLEEEKRLATHPGHINLYEQLQRQRLKQPVHGIILLLDLAWFAQSETSEREQVAKRIEAQLHEIPTHLGMRPRVYLCATHLESLAGYSAWHAHLGRTALQKLLGIHFSQQKNGHWRQELAAFWQQWHQQLLRDQAPLLMQANDRPSRGKLFEFQQQIQALGADLVPWLSTVISPAHALEMRGFFLGSHGKSSASAALPQQPLCQRYRLNPKCATTEGRPSLPACLQPLFGQALLSEAASSPRSTDYAQQQQGRRRASLLGLGLCSTVLVLGWFHYFQINQRAGEQLLQQLTLPIQEFGPSATQFLGLKQLTALEKQRDEMIKPNDRIGLPIWLADMGLSQRGRLRQALDQNYQSQLYQSLLPGLMQILHDQLLTAAAGSEEQMTLLTIMRILDDPQNHHPEWALTYIDEHLEALLPPNQVTSLTRPAREQIHEHLTNALSSTNWQQARRHGELIAIERYRPYAAAILTAQEELQQQPLEQHLYREIRQQAEEALPIDIQLINILDKPFTELLTSSDAQAIRVPSWFTRTGAEFLSAREAQLLQQGRFARWVLGSEIHDSASEEQKLLAKIRQLYQREATAYWERAFGHLEWQPPQDAPQLMRQLHLLNDPARPLASWIMRQQPYWPDGALPIGGITPSQPANQAPASASSLQPPPWTSLQRLTIADEAKNSPLTSLQRDLFELENYLGPILMAGDSGTAATQLLGTRSLDDPINRLRQHAQRLPPPLDRWMTELSNSADIQLRRQAAGTLNEQWQSEILAEYEQRLAHRYPFAPGASQDAELADIQQFFQPHGTFDNFYQKQRLILEHRNDDQTAMATNWAELQQAAEQAKRIQKLLFNHQGELEMQFVIEPLELSANQRRSLLNIDGQLVDYRHDQQAEIPLIWPNSEEKSAESTLTLVPVAKDQAPRSIQTSGAWALFRLLQQAQQKRLGKQETELVFQLNGGKMRYRLSSHAGAIDLDLFSRFKLPQRLE